MRKLSQILYLIVSSVVMTAFLPSCKSVTLADADDTMARGEYFAASNKYRKIYNRLTKPEERPLRGEVAYRLASCYQRLNRPVNAAASWQNALRYGQTDSIIHLRLAQALQASGKYPQAISEYEKYLESAPDAHSKSRHTRMQHCDIIQRRTQEPLYSETA